MENAIEILNIELYKCKELYLQACKQYDQKATQEYADKKYRYLKRIEEMQNAVNILVVNNLK